MIKVNLQSIYGKKEFDLENIDYDKLKYTAQVLRPHLDDQALFSRFGNKIQLLRRAKDATISNRDLYKESDVVKQLFINLFIFPNNQEIIDTLKKYEINIYYVETILKSIEKMKEKNISTVRFPFKGMSDIKKHYNINSSEFILNKLSEIFYYEPELIEECKTKTKSR